MSQSEKAKQTACNLRSEIIPNMYSFLRGGTSACACGEENRYRRLFYTFYFAYEQRREVFGYPKVLEDIHWMSYENTAIPRGARAHLFAHPSL